MTESPFAIVQLSNTPVDHTLLYATPRNGCHTLIYDEQYHEHLPYLVTLAAYKIERLWNARPEDRRLPTGVAGRRLPLEEEYELARLRGVSPRSNEVISRSKRLMASLMRQVTTDPVDIRVHREIAAALPAHQPRQRAYLRERILDFLPMLADRSYELNTAFTYERCAAMNLATAEALHDLSGTRVDRAMRYHSSYPIAQQLLEHSATSEQIPGVLGDQQVVAAWARELDLQDCYRWTPMSAI